MTGLNLILTHQVQPPARGHTPDGVIEQDEQRGKRSQLQAQKTFLGLDGKDYEELYQRRPQAEEQPINDVSERIAFFWMMAAVACKFITRREDETVEWFYKILQVTLSEVERLIHPTSNQEKKILPASQAQTLLGLCRQMNNLSQEALKRGFEITPAPLEEIKTLLNLSSQ